MDQDEAMRKLAAAGLPCKVSVGLTPAHAECTRMEMHALTTCIWRVTFDIDVQARSIGPITPQKAACKGP